MTHHSHTPAICEDCDPYPEFDSPEMPAEGYDAQTRRIPVALTVDQLEDAKLGRALRELGDGDIVLKHVKRNGRWQVYLYQHEPQMPHGWHTAQARDTLLAALTAARRELEERS